MRNRRLSVPFGLMILCAGMILTGCSHDNKSFENQSHDQQVKTLQGSMDQLSPERKKQIEAMAARMQAAHSGQGASQGGMQR